MPMQQRSDLTPPLGGGMKGYFPFRLTLLRFHVFLNNTFLITALEVRRQLAIEVLPKVLPVNILLFEKL